MTNDLILLPVIIQAINALVLLFLWNRIHLQRRISIFGNALGLAVAFFLFLGVFQNGIQVTQAGNWEAPFGITFVVDLFSASMILIASLSGLAVSIFASGSMSRRRSMFVFFPIFHFLLMGILGSFMAGDLFNLYVWFEMIIIASFGLITFGGGRRQLEGALKYVTLNLLASILFITAIAFIYGMTGTLNLADIAVKIQDIENKELVSISALLFFVGLGIKTAVFPLYFWLPASYHTPLSAISAIFGGLLTKVGVYTMLRIFSLFFLPEPFISGVITVVAIFTLLAGAMGAMIQNDLRKMFSWMIVCHIGFMIAGLGMYSAVAIAGAVFYLFHDIIVKTNLFMVSGLIHRITGSFKLKKLGGLYERHPAKTLLIAIPLFSLVGIPPLSGFWPKVLLINGGIETGSHFAIVAILIASFVTLFAIGKVWVEVFWKIPPNKPFRKHFYSFYDLREVQKVGFILPIAVLAAVSLFFGLGAGWVYSICEQIATDLMEPEKYIDVILNGNK